MTLSTRQLLFFLLATTALFALVNGLLGLQQYLTGEVNRGILYNLFDLNIEATIPTWFTTIVLFCSSLTLAAVARTKQRERDAFRYYWWALSLIFLYLSVDEAAQIHEHWDDNLEVIDNLPGFFYYGWVVPGMILVGISALVFARFFFHLGRATQTYLLIGAVTYVGGAIGMEMIGGYVLDTQGPGVVTGLIVIAEESLEQVGAILFLVAFLDYFQNLRRVAPPDSG